MASLRGRSRPAARTRAPWANAAAALLLLAAPVVPGIAGLAALAVLIGELAGAVLLWRTVGAVADLLDAAPTLAR